MKSVFLCGIVMAAAVLLIPLGALSSEKKAENKPTSAVTADEILYEAKARAYDSFNILISETGKIEKVSAKDYLFGCVASEMPQSFDDEALKAQTVAAYTFACRKKQSTKNNYDLSDSPETDQCYQSKEALRGKWGDSADEYTKRLEEIIDSVYGKVLTYDGKLALTVYHAVSSGKTESCENVWGQSLPYLISVDSNYDKLSSDYLSTVAFTSDELKIKLNGDYSYTEDCSSWFTDLKTTESGTVKSLKLCGKEISGLELSKALSLKSSCFEISFADGMFTFTVKGHGHGVGMSQYGADYMAKQGSTYEEILYHYYPECKIAS